MSRVSFVTSFTLAVLALGACKPAPPPVPKSTPVAATPTPVPTPAPTPTPSPSPSPSNSVVAVLGYHRFENPPGDSLALASKDFEAQMQRLKDTGVTVISMADFLAWRRGEKRLPPRCAVITIDDGYISGYTEAWPILKKFGYPATLFVYTNYISSGGKSITWQQLAEMRDAGVEIGSHSVSHASLNARKGRTDAEYEAWLWNELKGSKDILEQHLSTPIRTHAFPFGTANEHVKAAGLKAGYEALFTVNPVKTYSNAPNADSVGRYIIDSTKPQVFELAANFGGSAAVLPASAAAVAQANTTAAAAPAAAAMLTQPLEGEVVKDSRPLIKANLAALGKIDPKSVEMQLSGFGMVPAQYDASTGLITFQPTQRIRERTCTVTVTALAGGKKVSTRWTFFVEAE